MAEENGSGDGAFWGLVVLIAALLLVFPITSEIIFQWIPASVSFLSGEPSPTQTVQSTTTPNVVLTSTTTRADGTIIGSSASGDGAETAEDTNIWRIFDGSFFEFWQVFVPISIFISLLVLTGIIYAGIRLIQIRGRERTSLFRASHRRSGTTDMTRTQLRWERIKEESNSESSEKWRLAILEADIMLDELLDAQGYQGESMGEKMKQVERSDFNTIELAWEAHKVRNAIAHEGSAHELNQREVQRIIGLYEQVFKEFHFI